MPDLKGLKQLHSKYLRDAGSPFQQQIRSYSLNISSRLNMAVDSKGVLKAFSFAPGIGEQFEIFFTKRVKVDVALLFIDITDFSSKFQKATPDEVGQILDSYYETVIPIIYRHGGEVEKIIGDGIIAVFGPPFLKDGQLDDLYRAQYCAGDIVTALKGTPLESKVAAHYGTVMYYNNPSQNYADFTIVGNTLTELFRLESRSESSSINYFQTSEFDKNQWDLYFKSVQDGKSAFPSRYSSYWKEHDPQSVFWAGVPYSKLIQLQKLP